MKSHNNYSFAHSDLGHSEVPTEDLSALNHENSKVISQFTYSCMVKYNDGDVNDMLMSMEHGLKEVFGYYLNSVNVREIIKLGEIEIRSIMSTISDTFNEKEDFRAEKFCRKNSKNEKKSSDEELVCKKVTNTIQLEHNRKITGVQLNFFLLKDIQKTTDALAHHTHLDIDYVGFEGLSFDMELYLKSGTDSREHGSLIELMNTEECIFFFEKINHFLINHNHNYEVMDVILFSQKMIMLEDQSHSRKDNNDQSRHLKRTNVASVSSIISSDTSNSDSSALHLGITIHLQYLPSMSVDPRMLIGEAFVDRNKELLRSLQEMPYFEIFDSISLTNDMIEDIVLVKRHGDTSTLDTVTSADIDENGMLSYRKSLPLYENKPLFYSVYIGSISLLISFLGFILFQRRLKLKKRGSTRIESLRRDSSMVNVLAYGRLPTVLRR